MEYSLTLFPMDVEDLLATSLDPIEPLLDGSPDWCNKRAPALQTDDLGITGSLFNTEELESLLLLDSPSSLQLSPPLAAPLAAPQWRAPSEDPSVASGTLEQDDEPCAKRQRLSYAPVQCRPAMPLSAPVGYGLIPAPWQHVEVQQVEQQTWNAVLDFEGLMNELDNLPTTGPSKHAHNQLFQPTLTSVVAPCFPSTLIPESELMPGCFSHPASPSPIRTHAREPSASPNKPTTPVRLAVRSPFVTRPTRLAFEGVHSASPMQACTSVANCAPPAGVPQPQQEGSAAFSEEDAIRLAATALQACGGSADAAISYLLRLGGAAAAHM